MPSDGLTLAELTGGLFDGSSLPAASRGLLVSFAARRAEIVRHVVDRLRSQSTAQDRIFAGRVLPLSHGELPAVLVYGREEQELPPWSDAPRVLRRELQLAVEIVVDSEIADRAEQQLTAIAHVVEVLLGQDETLGGLVEDTVLGDYSVVAEYTGLKYALGARMVFRTPYQLELGAEPAGDLGSVQVDWETSEDRADPREAQDVVILPQG